MSVSRGNDKSVLEQTCLIYLLEGRPVYCCLPLMRVAPAVVPGMHKPIPVTLRQKQELASAVSHAALHPQITRGSTKDELRPSLGKPQHIHYGGFHGRALVAGDVVGKSNLALDHTHEVIDRLRGLSICGYPFSPPLLRCVDAPATIGESRSGTCTTGSSGGFAPAAVEHPLNGGKYAKA